MNSNDFIQLSEHIFCIPLNTNIGVIAVARGKKFSIYLIESGNDEGTAQQILSLLKNRFSDFTLEVVMNTHSHADHAGGNSFLKEKTGAEIWTSAGEAAFMEFPEVEPSLIWGGSSINGMKSKYFLAEPCRATRIFDGEEKIFIETEEIPSNRKDKSDKKEPEKGISIQVISLPGHYFDQIGFLIKDTDGKKIFFLGDTISGRNVIRKYWIQYLLDEQKMKETLIKISGIKADFYVPGHGNIVTDIEGLSELNIIALLETEDMILEELKTPKTTEEILKAVADRNSIKLGMAQYFLIGSTLRSYVSALYNAGKITFEIKENILYWMRAK